VITGQLANDTGQSNSDGNTSDPSILGTVTDAHAVTAFRAGFDNTPVGSFFDVFADSFINQNAEFLVLKRRAIFFDQPVQFVEDVIIGVNAEFETRNGFGQDVDAFSD
jgi:hypothetical protein